MVFCKDCVSVYDCHRETKVKLSHRATDDVMTEVNQESDDERENERMRKSERPNTSKSWTVL